MSEEKKDGGPIFPSQEPQVIFEKGHEHCARKLLGGIQSGLTKREFYAGMALHGWIASMDGKALDEYDRDGMEKAFKQHQGAVAKACFGYADAMIRQREKQ